MNRFSRKNERGFTMLGIVSSVAVLGAVIFTTVNIGARVVENAQSNMLAKQVIELQDAATRCYSFTQVDGGCAAADGDGWDLGVWNTPNHVDATGAVNPVLQFLVSNLANEEMTDEEQSQWDQWDISRVDDDTLIFMRDVDDAQFAIRTLRNFADNRSINNRPYKVDLSVLAKGSNLLHSSFERSDIVSTDSGEPSVKSGGLDRAYDQEYIDLEVSPVLAISQGAPTGSGTDVDLVVAKIVEIEMAKLLPNTEINRTYVTTTITPYIAPRGSIQPKTPQCGGGVGSCGGSAGN